MNDYNKAMIQSVAARLEGLKKDIIAGKIKVPSDKKQLEAFLATLK